MLVYGYPRASSISSWSLQRIQHLILEDLEWRTLLMLSSRVVLW